MRQNMGEEIKPMKKNEKQNKEDEKYIYEGDDRWQKNKNDMNKNKKKFSKFFTV
jgi:hypothetical protein